MTFLFLRPEGIHLMFSLPIQQMHDKGALQNQVEKPTQFFGLYPILLSIQNMGINS